MKVIPLLIDALILDPDHCRKDTDESVKAAIQADAADCLLQLAVFEPHGRQLLESNHAVIEALHALADGKAFTEAAQISANGALMALEGRVREPEPAREGDEAEADLHLMMSYQWDHQRVIERVVRSLQTRGHLVWFGAHHTLSNAFGCAIAHGLSVCCRLGLHERLDDGCHGKHRNLPLLVLPVCFFTECFC